MNENYFRIDENIVIDLNALNKEQLSQLTDAVQQQKIKIIENNVENLSSRTTSIEIDVNILKENQKEQEKINSEFNEKMNYLSSPDYKGIRKKFTAKASQRVRNILGGTTTAEYVLFSHYFHKRIYNDIAKEMENPTWDHFSMKEYDKVGSLYQTAQELRDSWLPSKQYMNYCINQLIIKRDNGILASEKCRALTTFLSATNNGKDVAFAA